MSAALIPSDPGPDGFGGILAEVVADACTALGIEDEQNEEQYSGDATIEELFDVLAPYETAFAIDSEERANWYLSKLANIETERARVKAQAAVILAALDRREQSLKGRFDAQLADWARERLAGAKTKTLRLLQGTIAFRTVAGSLRLIDKEAAFVHARTELPECIITREELDAAAYRKRAQETGEVLPGIETVPGRESMSLKFAAGTTANDGGGDEE